MTLQCGRLAVCAKRGDIANCSGSVGGTRCEKTRHKIFDLPWPVAFRDGVLARPQTHLLSPDAPDIGRLLSRNLVTGSHVSGLLAPLCGNIFLSMGKD